VLVGYAAFDAGVQDWAIFSGAVPLGTAVFVTLGYALAGLARTAESAMAVAQLVNVPMMMLSGSFFETEMLPGFFRGVVRLLPRIYLGDLLRASMTGSRPLHEPLIGFAVLGGWFSELLLLAVGLWKWKRAGSVANSQRNRASRWMRRSASIPGQLALLNSCAALQRSVDLGHALLA
jgi:ABC-type multidrug transport system permease subunit